MYLNKVIIFGNLTRDPELRSLPTGGNVASFGIATNRTWRTSEGQKQEATEYHNIVVFGRQAETTAQYLHKGDSALVEGRLQTRNWDAQDGSKRSRTEIVAERVQFGPKRGAGSGGAPVASPVGGNAASRPAAPVGEVEYPEEDINPEDIPF